MGRTSTTIKHQFSIMVILIIVIIIFSTANPVNANQFSPENNSALRLAQVSDVLSFNSTIVINEDNLLEVKDNLLIKNTLNGSNEIVLSTNGMVSSVSINTNVSLQVFLIPSESNSTIKLLLSDQQWSFALVSVNYQINNLVMSLGEAYFLSYGLPLRAQKVGYVDVALPPHSIIIQKNVGGETIPLVSPKPTSNYTDGVRAHLRWEPANQLLEQPIVIEFLMEPPTQSFQFTWEYLAFYLAGLVSGMALITAIIFGIKYWNKKKAKSVKKEGTENIGGGDNKTFTTASPPLKVVNLTDHERKIIYALMDLDMKASQETLRKELGWGKSKLSTYLKRLESKGVITRKEAGRQKIVYLIGPIEL